ncbi:MAG: trypsin-like serine protease [Sandaracinaceae bacterium]|nr:trypsin-like serine protease [Sandaracinaceae bacterium]
MRARLATVLLLALAPGCVGELSLDVPGRPTDAGARPGPPSVYLDGGPPPGPSDAGGLPPVGHDAAPPPTRDECGDLRTVSTVHFGTPQPTHLPMRPGQIYAVGSFNGCSGLVVGDRWVLSATHCNQRPGTRFCVDRQARNPQICFTVANVYREPSGSDLTLLQLSESVTARFPELEPVLPITDDLDASWVGRMTEAGGFGQQESGGFNEREFTANPISQLSRDRVVVDGRGRSGVCYGDSGGPIMVVADDGSIRTIGVVSDGDGTCTYVATFTRVDLYRAFIERHMGPIAPPGPPPCGDVTREGACVDGSARFCGPEDHLVVERCAGSCGWDFGANGFRCLSGPDPCGGLSPRGQCDGDTARWCERGAPRARDCGACRQRCATSATVGATCE